MNRIEIRKRFRVIKEKVSTLETHWALIRAMKKSKMEGIEINSRYLHNVEKFVANLEAEMDQYLK